MSLVKLNGQNKRKLATQSYRAFRMTASHVEEYR